MNIDTLRLFVGASSVAASADARQVARTAPAAGIADVVKSGAAPSPEAIRSAASQIDSYLKSIGRTLDIRVDQDTGRTVVTVRDSETGETIRQIPSEEALELARSLGRGIQPAVILDQTA